MVFASKIFLVRPAQFGYNPQTAASNSFQKLPEYSRDESSRMALAEFDAFAAGISGLGIQVVVGEDRAQPHTPDAVFPNNWFSTHPDGTLVLYPMEAEARRKERDPLLIQKISSASAVRRTIDLSSHENEGRFLEGTGSLVLDHVAKTAYACISSRTHPGLVSEWASATGYRPVAFRAYGSDGTPVYHTNVLMCLGAGFAVLCAESITDPAERGKVIGELEAGGREVIRISQEQMAEFAGNMIQLENVKGERILVMSERARESLDREQLEAIIARTKIASFSIPTIEDCGGGSVRCMIAELF